MRLLVAVVLLSGVAGAGLYQLAGSAAVAPQPPGPPKAVNAADPPRPPDYEELLRKAEKRPDPPLAAAGNEHKKLQPDGSLLLELAPDPANPDKKKPVRVLLAAEVCLTKGFLEVFLCRNNTKEHEAVVRTPVKGELIHGALLAAGAKPGSPVQFIDPKTDEPAYKPATGTAVRVDVHFRKAGAIHTKPAQEWVTDAKTGKAMAHKWVFAGSRQLTNPDDPATPPYYAANSGLLISVSNFRDAMLDVPVEVSSANAELMFEARTDALPPMLSGVWVILTPQP